MIYNTYQITLEGSQPGARLTTYIQDHSEEIAVADRPLILVCPGGGYEWTSEREGEPLAMQFPVRRPYFPLRSRSWHTVSG